MTKLEYVDQTFEYLKFVYELTKISYIKGSQIKSKKFKGLNYKSLHKCSYLHELNGGFRWNGISPKYSTAYDYYHKIRGNENNYQNLLEILENPQKYSGSELHEALRVTVMTREDDTTESSIIAKPLQKHSSVVDLFSHSQSESIDDKLDKIVLSMEKILDGFITLSNEHKTIIELLGENVMITLATSKSVKSSQNSIGTTIAILKSNQKNIFDITATEFNILREIYYGLSERTEKDPEKYGKRKENIGKCVEYMRQRMNSNNTITTRYGNG